MRRAGNVDLERRGCVYPRSVAHRVLVVSASRALTTELGATLFAAGSTSRTCVSVRDAACAIAESPEWATVLALSAELPDGSAADVVRVANAQRAQANVVIEQEERVDLWLARLADAGVSVRTGAPVTDPVITTVAQALVDRDRESCRAALPEDVVLLVRRGMRSRARQVCSLGLARGRVRVSDAVFALLSDAPRIVVAPSLAGATLIASFDERHALLTRARAEGGSVALELAWYERRCGS